MVSVMVEVEQCLAQGGKTYMQDIIREKSIVKMLLSIAQSDREHECVRYVIYKASGMTSIAIRRAYGFENMKSRGTNVEEAVYEIQKIHEGIFN